MNTNLNTEIFEIVNQAVHNTLKTHHGEIAGEIGEAFERWGEIAPDEDLAGDVIDTICEVVFAGADPEKLLGDYETILLEVAARWTQLVHNALGAIIVPKMPAPISYVCRACGYTDTVRYGRCHACGAFNTFVQQPT